MKEYEIFEKQPMQEHFKEVFYVREEYRNLYEKYINPRAAGISHKRVFFVEKDI